MYENSLPYYLPQHLVSNSGMHSYVSHTRYERLLDSPINPYVIRKPQSQAPGRRIVFWCNSYFALLSPIDELWLPFLPRTLLSTPPLCPSILRLHTTVLQQIALSRRSALDVSTTESSFGPFLRVLELKHLSSSTLWIDRVTLLILLAIAPSHFVPYRHGIHSSFSSVYISS